MRYKGEIQYPELKESYSFDDYLGFLTENGLITKENDEYYITVSGRDFLSYMIFEGLSQEKDY